MVEVITNSSVLLSQLPDQRKKLPTLRSKRLDQDGVSVLGAAAAPKNPTRYGAVPALRPRPREPRDTSTEHSTNNH